MKIIARIITTIILIILIPLIPWWLWCTLVIAALLLWQHYYEAMVLAFVYDVAAGLSHHVGWYPFFYGSIVVCISIEVLKQRLIFYRIHE